MAPISLFLLFILTHLLLPSSANSETHHPPCPEFPCGKRPLHFPFYNKTNLDCGLYAVDWEEQTPNKTNLDCGLYAVDCEEQPPKIQFRKGGHWFKTDFISLFQDSVTINDGELNTSLDLCKFEDIQTFALPIPSVISNVFSPNLSTLFKCNRSLAIHAPQGFIHISCQDYDIYYSDHSDIGQPPCLPECSMIQIPPAKLCSSHSINISTHFDLAVKVNSDCNPCFNIDGDLCKTDINNNQLVCNDARKGTFTCYHVNINALFGRKDGEARSQGQENGRKE